MDSWIPHFENYTETHHVISADTQPVVGGQPPHFLNETSFYPRWSCTSHHSPRDRALRPDPGWLHECVSMLSSSFQGQQWRWLVVVRMTAGGSLHSWHRVDLASWNRMLSPMQLARFASSSSPRFLGDLNNDGTSEILLTGHQFQLYPPSDSSYMSYADPHFSLGAKLSECRQPQNLRLRKGDDNYTVAQGAELTGPWHPVHFQLGQATVDPITGRSAELDYYDLFNSVLVASLRIVPGHEPVLDVMHMIQPKSLLPDGSLLQDLCNTTQLQYCELQLDSRRGLHISQLSQNASVVNVRLDGVGETWVGNEASVTVNMRIYAPGMY